MSGWQAVSPQQASALRDSRLQLHHAAQLATAAGISYLPARPDDSHTNLEWLPRDGVLASNPVPASGGPVRIGVRVRDLTLLCLRAAGAGELPLNGQTVASATTWLRGQLGPAGLDAAAYTLERHYEIPAHGVSRGAAFAARVADLGQLAAWFGGGYALLEALRTATPGASDVRCWPHHFDIATLIELGASASVGIGLEPGDAYYDEPYFYVNVRPQPRADRLPQTLMGQGSWHTHEWIGAVLPGSRLAADPAAQARQVDQFLASAVAACRALAGGKTT